MKNKIASAKRLEKVRYDVRGPVVDEAARMERRGEKIIKLNIGNPTPYGFDATDNVLPSINENFLISQGYSESHGLAEAREAIAAYCAYKNIGGVIPENIFTGNGVSELIITSMQALLSSGDEMLIPSPDYPLWTAAVTLSGGKPVHYVCDESSDWYPDIEDIKSKITPRTRGIIIINPNNPTGAVYPREVLEDIVKVCVENDLVIFSDEIYDRLVMDGIQHISIASLTDEVLCVTFNGLSKSDRIPGLRCGWLTLSGDLESATDYIAALHLLSSMRLCSNVIAQSVISASLRAEETNDPLYKPGGRMYEQREFVYNALCSIPGVSVIKPRAAFYIFPKIDLDMYDITDDEQTALRLLREKKVLVVHGTGFNIKTPDHFRMTYLAQIPTLKTALERIADFLTTVKKK